MAKKVSTKKTTKKKSYKKKPNGKNATGRKTKLTDDFIKAAEQVILHDINAIIFTDEELLILINEQLAPEAQISENTFINWKAEAKSENTHSELLTKFLCLIKKALVDQKKNLFAQLKTGKYGEWTKFAWIIERKFDEWNLKQKGDFNNNLSGTIKVLPPEA